MPQIGAAIAAIASSVAAETFAIASEVGLSVGTAATIANVAYAVADVAIYAGLTIGVGLLTAPKVPSPAALQTPLKQPMPVRQSAFGRVRVSGSYALYTAGSGGAKTTSNDVLALLDGRSHQVVNYWLNDDLMAQNAGGYWYAPGAYGKYGQGDGAGNLVQIDSRVGNTPETAYAISGNVPLWTSDHRGDGVTSMVLVCKQAHKEDQAACFPNGVPTPSASIDAQLVFDPRDSGQAQGSPETYVFSDNPVLCLLSYLTDAAGGMGLSYDRFVVPSIAYLMGAADECDALVATSGMHATLAEGVAAGDSVLTLNDVTGLSGGVEISLATETVTVSSVSGVAVTLTGGVTYAHSLGELAYWDGDGQRRKYSCNGTYRHDNAPGDVIKSILSTFDGWVGQRGDGALVVRTNAIPATPAVTLTDQHVVAYSVQHFLPDEQAVNQLIVSYTDPAAAFNTAEAGYVQDDADIAARGQVRSQQLPLDWVSSAPQAIDVASAALARATQPLRGTVTCNLAGLAVLGERYVGLQISELAALNNVIVEVTGKPTIDLSSMTVTIPWIAATSSGGITIPSGGGVLTPPMPSSPGGLDPLPAPTIVSVTPEYPDSGGGVAGARLSIVVDDPGFENIGWKVRWKLSADTVWTSAGDSLTAAGSPLTLLTGLVAATGSIDVQVAYFTATQTSPWSATTTVTVDAPLPVVTDTATASEALTAGNVCNLYTASGAAKVQKANATDLTKPANCFVLSAVSSGAAADVYLPGQWITGLSGLTPGATYYLSTTAGAVTTTCPSTSGNGAQIVGTANAAGDALFFAPQPMTGL